MKKLSCILLLSFLAYGCGKCGDIMCECITPSINLKYENDSISCQSFQNLVQVKSYDQADDQLMEDAFVDAWGCTFALPLVEPKRYWVVSSDSLNISDTVGVNHVSFKEGSDDDCCDCPDPVEEIVVTVNDEVYSDVEVVVDY